MFLCKECVGIIFVSHTFFYFLNYLFYKIRASKGSDLTGLKKIEWPVWTTKVGGINAVLRLAKF